jgi:AcrR family transcriptional regulator
VSAQPAQRRSPKGIAVRARIVATAWELLALRGYEGATVQLVCSAAEVSRNQFFHHFGSKDALVLTVLEAVHRAWRDELLGPAAGFPPGQPRLAFSVDKLAELSAADGLGLRLLASLTGAPAVLPELVAKELRDILDDVLDFLRALAKERRRDGLAPGLKARAVAGQVLSVLLGAAQLSGAGVLRTDGLPALRRLLGAGELDNQS